MKKYTIEYTTKRLHEFYTLEAESEKEAGEKLKRILSELRGIKIERIEAV